MIEFLLAKAHPQFQRMIPMIIKPLAEKYPQAPLKLVTLYEPTSDDDHSMGYTDEDGNIFMNPYWFAAEPQKLRDEGQTCVDVKVAGRRVLWHGLMTDEPLHVLTHEFGHSLSYAVPGWEEWAYVGWLAGTQNPENAISGYALAGIPGKEESGPPEFWAENFAGMELQLGPVDARNAIKRFLDERL